MTNFSERLIAGSTTRAATGRRLKHACGDGSGRVHGSHDEAIETWNGNFVKVLSSMKYATMTYPATYPLRSFSEFPGLRTGVS
jgi:hypothetical protein